MSKMKKTKENFVITNFDGWQVHLLGDRTYLEFDTYEEARDVAIVWDLFLNDQMIGNADD